MRFMKYIVIEIQVQSDGTTGTFTWAYDNTADAMAKYYSVLAVAVQSQVAVHTAVILDETGSVYRKECIRHEEVAE